MRRLLTIGTLLYALSACSPGNSDHLTEENKEPETPVAEVTEVLTGNYGAEITEEGAVSTAEMLTMLEGTDSLALKVQSEILATCAVKGCWMNVALNDKDKMRVTFKDYGFFVPKNGVEGKNTIVEGYVKKVTTDVETLKHFAKDAGKSQEEIDVITEPQDEITFVASGVIIKD